MKKDNIVTNAFFQGITGIISKIGSLIFTIILARMLFPDLFGLYSLALTILLTLVAFTDFGLGTTITRYLAESKTHEKARSRFLFLFNIKILLALIASILLFLLSNSIATFYKNPDLVLPLQVGALYLFLTAAYGVMGSVLLAFQKLRYNAVMEIIFQISRISIVALFLLYSKTVESIFLALSLATLITLIIGLFFIFLPSYSFLFKGAKEPTERKRMLSFSSFIVLSSIGMLVFSNIDKLFLGYFVSLEFIGYYTVILTLISGALGLFSFTSILFPKFTELEKDKLQQIFHKSINYLSMLVFPATFGLAYLALPLLRLLYGNNYVPSEYSSTLFIIAFILSFLLLEGVLTGVYKMLFNSREQSKIPAFTTIISAVINIALTFFLISYFIKFSMVHALLGASIALVISRYLDLAILIILIKPKTGISPGLKFMIKPIIASLIMLLFLIMIRPYFTQWGVIILITLAIIIYLISLFILRGINIREILSFVREIKLFNKYHPPQ